MLGPACSRLLLWAVVAAVLAASPAQAVTPAKTSRAGLSFRIPQTAYTGQQLTISGQMRKARPAGATARLEQLKGRRWRVLAKARVKRGGRFTLRFVAPKTPGVITVRVRVLRKKRVVVASRKRLLRLARRPAPPSPPLTQTPGPAPAPNPAPPQPTGLVISGNELSVPLGSVADIGIPAPLTSILSLKKADGADGFAVTQQNGAWQLAAESGGARTTDVTLTGTGCTDSACPTDFTLELSVTVRSVAADAGTLEAFTSPSPGRVAAGIPDGGGTALTDELDVTLGTPDAVGSRSDADYLASQVGAVVSGGLEDLGVYELRWDSAQDLDARIAELESYPGVTAATRVVVGLVSTTAVPPGDWDDDGPQATWPFTQIRAEQAWDTTTGTNTTVGIVDGGTVYKDHEDLDVVGVLGGDAAQTHATHVAGLACAEANGKGVVGAAWGCPLVTSGIGDGSPSAVLAAARAVAKSGARVVNLSLGYQLGYFCHTADQQATEMTEAKKYKDTFRQLFQGPIGSGIVWTVSAGNNCAEGVPSPWGLNSDLPNVISVAATNSDATLASFSDFGAGVEVAAPGGVSDGDVGLWSTWFTKCGLFSAFTCGGYQTDSGTSMSAPVVAGVAALVRDAHPSFGAAEAAACITQSAGLTVGWVDTRSAHPTYRTPSVAFDGTADRVPIVNAEAAVACTDFDSTDAGAYVGTWTGQWLLSIYEESPGVLAAINQSETPFTNGCSAAPGLEIANGLTLGGLGQWDGNIVVTQGYCDTFSYEPTLAMRAVRSGDEVYLVFAWPQSPGGTRPSIDVDGNVVSDTPYFSTWLWRPATGSPPPASRRSPKLSASSRGAVGSVPAP